MKIGILTGGGDAPGLNSVIYGVLLRAYRSGHQVIGLKKGWRLFSIPNDELTPEVIQKNTVELKAADHDDLHTVGGTIIYSSRTNPFKDVKKIEDPEKKEAALDALAKDMKSKFDILGIDCLIAIGGDDTCGVADLIYKRTQAQVICCPKTIDNDLNGTDYTFGFYSGAQLASDVLDNIQTTASSHQRIFVMEVMGRDAGWLTLYSGISAGSGIILLPEENFDFEKDIVEVLKKRSSAGYKYHIIACSEGAQPTKESLERDFPQSQETFKTLKKDNFGNPILAGVISQVIRNELEKRDDLKDYFAQNDCPLEVREVVIGHTMRVGTPNVFDRILGLRFGLKAAKCIEEGKFGVMVALDGDEIVTKSFEEALSAKKYVNLESDLAELRELLVNVKYESKL